MEQYCQNPHCENHSAKEVPVSVKKPSDHTRALCAICEEAYSWGVQHGTMSARKETIWLMAVADRGLIAQVRAYGSKTAAEKGLLEYLQKYHAYNGQGDTDTVWKWLHDHDECLSVEIVSQRVEKIN